VHLQESLRENSILRGYAAQTATQFLQSKSQQMPSHGTANAVILETAGVIQ
jgi:hypothetical protein